MNAFIEKVLNIWMAGGWTMIPLAVLGLMTYGAAVRLFLYFRRRDFQNVSQETWMQWLRDPQKGRGEVGEIIRYAHEDIQGEEDIRSRFAEVALSKIPYMDRNIAFINILVTAAPLIGLLGNACICICVSGNSFEFSKCFYFVSGGLSQKGNHYFCSLGGRWSLFGGGYTHFIK